MIRFCPPSPSWRGNCNAKTRVWILAERLGLSAIITVVAYAMTLARHVPGLIGARHRISSYAVWEVAVFVLNVLAFVLIGLQLRGILSRVDGTELGTYLLCAGAVCAAVILIRFVWMPYNWFVRWRIRRYGAHLPRPMSLPTIGTGLLISWCGMRGIVTLAAALALPILELESKGSSLDVEILRREYQARMGPGDTAPEGLADLQRHAALVQRRTLVDLRARSVIGDDAFHAAEEEIDLIELTASSRIRPSVEGDAFATGGPREPQ